MTTDQPSDEQIHILFLRALDLPLGQNRSEWLQVACGGNQTLIGRVSDLLKAHEEETITLQEPEEATRVVPNERAGERMGRYRLLNEIGAGGFGTVWAAEQTEPVLRRVALKIIKLGMDTREVIARFEAERQALAMMDHPNIARVLDAGSTDTGRPFFVMELVNGIPITRFCDEQRLGMRARLALFGDVCAAISHAHQKGIIHRDIKPSNVMVTLIGDKPVVKVIDFGIAKATGGKLTDKTIFTRLGQFIGTPAYMSPEQASLGALDVDTRSDIYALGILLYELLTGKPPFDARSLLSAGFEEMRRIICEVEPQRPSSRLSTVSGEERTALAQARQSDPAKLDRLVEPDLDWIVMKAIEKDRTRRYDTANGLAQDIARFLADEPVSATPPSATYRFRKFARRNRTALRVAATISVLLIGATAVSIILMKRAMDAEERLSVSLTQSEASRKEAEDVSSFLIDTFQKPDPRRDGRTVTIAETLDTAVTKLDTGLSAHPDRLARLQAVLGGTYHALGLDDRSIPLMEKVLIYYRGTHGLEHPYTLKAMNNLGVYYFDVGRRREAQKLWEEVLPVRRRVLGPEHPETIATLHNLANSVAGSGRFEEGLRLREEVLALQRNMLGPEHPNTLTAMINVVLSLNDVGRPQDALQLCRDLLLLSKKVSGPEHPDTLQVMQGLANSLDDTGQKEEAFKLRQEVLPLFVKVLGPEHGNTLTAMMGLAKSLGDFGREQEAIQLWEELLPLLKNARSLDHPNTLTAMFNLASQLNDAGRRDEALRLNEEVLTLRRKVLGNEHPDTLIAMINLGTSYYSAGRRREALDLHEQTLRLCREVLGLEHKDTASAMHNLATAYYESGRRDEALKLREELLPLRRKLDGPDHARTVAAMINLATSLADVDRHAEAVKLREEVVATRREVLGPEHPLTLAAMSSLAIALEKEGRLADAVTLQEQTLHAKRRVLTPDHAYLTAAKSNMLSLYEKAGRVADAKALRQELLNLSGPLDESSPPVTASLIPQGAAWKWIHPCDGVDPAVKAPDFHQTFFAADYDDSAWQTGRDSEGPAGGFAYGEEDFQGVDLGSPADVRIPSCAYFRCRFTTDKLHAGLELRCHRDDGIIIYLDGREVARDNMISGPEAWLLPAAHTVSGEFETAVQRIPLNGVSLPAGEHILAISLHNTQAPSSDLRIGGISLVATMDAVTPGGNQ